MTDPAENPGLALMRKTVALIREAIPQTFCASEAANADPTAPIKALQRETAFMSRDRRERLLVQCVCAAQLLDGLLETYEILMKSYDLKVEELKEP